MESAATQLARPLPPILSQGKTMHMSSRRAFVAIDYLFAWHGFKEEARSWIASTDLSFLAPMEDTAEEAIYVGNEAGLLGRFMQQVGVVISRICNVGGIVELEGTRFGDYHTVRSMEYNGYPDITVVKDQHQRPSTLRVTGEMKPFWHLGLENIDVNNPADLPELQEPIGQLIGYMLTARHRFGFLTTYNATIFVRRVDNFHFDLSPVILASDTDLTMRQCFLFFAKLISTDDYLFSSLEGYGEHITSLLFQRELGVAASTRPSPYRPSNHSTTQQICHNVYHNSVVIGFDGSNFGARILNQITPRVFEVSEEMEGNGLIMKHWRIEEEEWFMREVKAYEAIECLQGAPFPAFANLLAYGPILCSSVLPEGFVAILSQRPGEPLDNAQWRDIGEEERLRLKNKLISAVRVLRSIGAYHAECRKGNILYDRVSGELTLLDLESIQTNTYNFSAEDGPEVRSFLRRPFDG